MSPIYFDHNATTALASAARAAMEPYLSGTYGNPSSVHAFGRAARDGIERARLEVAELVGAAAEEIVFTSGGTEGDHLALRGAAEAARAADPARTGVLVSPLEHPAVLGAAAELAERGFRVERLRVDPSGVLDLEDAGARLGPTMAVASVQLANHELGNINPVGLLAARAQAAGVWLHTDAVQAAGKLPIDLRALGVDVATLSAHKLGGPKGVGAVWLRAGRTLAPLVRGGHQERERRPGTENVPGIVGFGAACAQATRELAARITRMGDLRDRLERGLCALDGARLNGDRAARVVNTCNVAFAGVEAELLVAALDLEGVAVSTGAACSSGSVEPSPVLLALGQERQQAASAVRFSLGPTSTEAEVDRVLQLLPSLLARVRAA